MILWCPDCKRKAEEHEAHYDGTHKICGSGHLSEYREQYERENDNGDAEDNDY